jgi:hypothetical protein
MANYNRGGQVFRSVTVGGVEIVAMVVGEMERVYDGVQSLTLTGTSQSPTVPSGATHALIYADGGTVNDYARDWHGTTPTASVGKKLKDHEELASAQPAAFRALNGSGTVTLRIEFYHYA